MKGFQFIQSKTSTRFRSNDITSRNCEFKGLLMRFSQKQLSSLPPLIDSFLQVAIGQQNLLQRLPRRWSRWICKPSRNGGSLVRNAVRCYYRVLHDLHRNRTVIFFSRKVFVFSFLCRWACFIDGKSSSISLLNKQIMKEEHLTGREVLLEYRETKTELYKYRTSLPRVSPPASCIPREEFCFAKAFLKL